MQIEFRLLRQQPPQPPQLVSYALDLDPSRTVLDALLHIKEEIDGSLGLRKNCRNMICGSCAVRINGQAGLACGQHLGAVAREGVITVAPLGNLPVIKDLVVDMQAFWDQLERVDPYVCPEARQLPEREFLQTPDQRQPLQAAANCILCGACYSDCQSVPVHPQFVGPHALAKANRLLKDNRDSQRRQRLRFLNSLSGVWGCTRCHNCNVVCPMGVAPLDQITEIKQGVLRDYRRRKNALLRASRAIRHRLTLVALVREGGWIDERRFGLEVVGNQGRDLAGLASLAPLGLRLIRKGKFPWTFHPSSGSGVVKKLIDLVRQEDSCD
ncbi:MAG: succinate dehydrogenase/fumarate reductase iron-sulfur subunit [Thermostichales cyanobacterium BF4_bins_65]